MNPTVFDNYESIVRNRYLLRLTQYKPNDHHHKLMSSAYQASMIVDHKSFDDIGRKYIFKCYHEQLEFEAKFFDTYHEQVETIYVGTPQSDYGYTILVYLTYHGKKINFKVKFKPKNKTKKYTYMDESSETIEGLINKLIEFKMDKLAELFLSSTTYVYEDMIFSNKIPQEKIDAYYKLYSTD